MSDAFRAALASAAPAGARPARGPTGHQRCRRVAGFTPVTDAMLRRLPADDWLMIRGNYQAWNYSELDRDHARQRRRPALEWIWSMTDGGWNEPAPRRARRRSVSQQHGQHHPGARRRDRRADLGEPRRAVGPTGDAMRGLAIFGDKLFIATTRRAARRARRTQRPNRLGDDHRRSHGRRVRQRRAARSSSAAKCCKAWATARCSAKRSASSAPTTPNDGRQLWKFDTVATTGTPGGDTWGDVPD